MPFTIVALRGNEIHTTTDKCEGAGYTLSIIKYNLRLMG